MLVQVVCLQAGNKHVKKEIIKKKRFCFEIFFHESLFKITANLFIEVFSSSIPARDGSDTPQLVYSRTRSIAYSPALRKYFFLAE